VVVSTPPAWKVKKEKLEQAKKAAEAAARQAAEEAVKAAKTPPPVRYLQLLPPEQAIMTLKAFWPQLFEGNARACWQPGCVNSCLRTLRA
jgi:predicted Zn-dependent protease